MQILLRDVVGIGSAVAIKSAVDARDVLYIFPSTWVAINSQILKSRHLATASHRVCGCDEAVVWLQAS